MFDARPFEDWAMISSQNRWQGVVFAGDPNCRIYPVPQPVEGSRASLNAWWSAQAKGTLITQRLTSSSKAGPMQVWFSHAGLGPRSEKEGWIFVKAPRAFAAIRVVEGAWDWKKDTAGDWLVCQEANSPVILEVARHADFLDFAEFQSKVLSKQLSFESSRLDYTSVKGDHFTFDAAYRELPMVNGKRIINDSPRASLQSPFVNVNWNASEVTVSMDGRTQVLDFDSP